MDYDYSNLGLFGRIEDAQIRNLNLEAEEVSGKDNVGLLAGCVEGDSRIYEVTVNGVIYAEGDGGGIAGEVTGGSEGAVIENCRADSIVINSENQGGFVGGIAGNVQNAFLVDVTAITMDGDSSRIQGKGYVGGIAGRQNETDIYNVYVAGTIGGNGTRAVGGITGLYESGNLVVARFDGEISRTNNGAASQEGTFIGTREPGNGFRYGTGADDNVSFLYASSANQAKNLNSVQVLPMIIPGPWTPTSGILPIMEGSMFRWRESLRPPAGSGSFTRNWRMESAISLPRKPGRM